MKICRTCPVNSVSKTEGLGECEPCEVGKVANSDKTSCGEFGVNLIKHHIEKYELLFWIPQ